MQLGRVDSAALATLSFLVKMVNDNGHKNKQTSYSHQQAALQTADAATYGLITGKGSKIPALMAQHADSARGVV